MSRPFLNCPYCAGALTPSADGRARARCPACGFAHYDNPVPVVSAIVEHDGRVVLARNKAWPPTWYALVAGFLERDEAPDDAVRREVKEELGLDALSTQLVGASRLRIRPDLPGRLESRRLARRCESKSKRTSNAR